MLMHEQTSKSVTACQLMLVNQMKISTKNVYVHRKAYLFNRDGANVGIVTILLLGCLQKQKKTQTTAITCKPETTYYLFLTEYKTFNTGAAIFTTQ